MIIQSLFPSLGKRGQGRFFKEIINKIPLLQRGILKGELFINKSMLIC
jgi:hypothetical protein